MLKEIPTQHQKTPLNIIYSVTYYLKSHNAVTIYCTSNLTNKRLNWLLGHYETSTSSLGKKFTLIIQIFRVL